VVHSPSTGIGSGLGITVEYAVGIEVALVLLTVTEVDGFDAAGSVAVFVDRIGLAGLQAKREAVIRKVMMIITQVLFIGNFFFSTAVIVISGEFRQGLSAS
jgi:hypothetical protein